MTYDIIVLGSGPAGLTAGIYGVRAGHKSLVIGGSRWGGQLMLTTLVENFPGFTQGVQGPSLMMNMKSQAERLGVEFVNEEFTSVDFKKKPFEVSVGGKKYQGKTIIIATGAESIWLNVPGELELRGRGVSSCATCDAFFFRGKDVIIVGGGDSAIEEALYIANVARTVTIVHRRDKLRASYLSQQKLLAESKARIIWNAQLLKYNGKEKLESVDLELTSVDGQLAFRFGKEEMSVSAKQFNSEWAKKFGGGEILENKKDKVLWKLPINGVFVAIGHKPNTSRLNGIELDAKGYVVRKEVKDENGLLKYAAATNIDGIFVAGDVHDYRYRQAITAAGFGAMAALDADHWLEGEVLKK